jgi:CHAT domain-containing protein
VLWVYLRIGEVREKQGNLEGALQYYQQAAEVLERLGAGQQLPELQLSSREQTWGLYENLTRVSLELYAKRPSADLLNQAFIYHERGRARALLDLLNDAGVRARAGVAPKLVIQEDELQAKIAALQNAFSDQDISDLKKTNLQQGLAVQEAALQGVHAEIAAVNSKYASLAPQTATIAEVQTLLDSDTVLLEYDLGPEFSGVGVLTSTEAHIYRLPGQDVINKSLEEFLPTVRAPLIGKAEIDRHIELAKGLYLTLLGPVLSQIRDKHHIVIVPDDSLYYLPFEALIAANQGPNLSTDSLASQAYLGKTYDFSYAPSASVLVTLERIEAGKASPRHALLAFGDPALQSSPAPAQVALSTRGAYEQMGVGFERLPYSAEEVRGIAAAYGIKRDSNSIYLGSKATKKALMGLDLTQYSILHFATHAVMGDQVKWINQPALILSPDLTGEPDDGLLKMSEIFNLQLNATLVVLSACETARGNISRGEGIVGLTSAFLFAGSRSVVASLWDVNDESTSLFMEYFYAALKGGLTKGDALSKARRELMYSQIKNAATGEEESLASPYYWAPFILVGEWK